MKIKIIVLLFSLITIQVFAQGAGNALQFDGSDDYVTCGNNASLDITGALTVEAWVNFTDFTIPYPAVVSKAEGSSGYGLEKINGQSTVGFWILDGANNYINAATNELSSNTWYHIAGTWSGGLISIYVNGVLIRTQASSAPATTSSDLRIGLHSSLDEPERHFKGKIDEVRVWNTALVASTISDWMNTEVTGSHPNYNDLKGYWKFNEGSGTTAADSKGTNTGTLIGGVSWIVSDAPLPVELTSFTGTVNGNEIILNWQTATEVNNYGFEIQRPVVSDQRSEWETIGFVEGHGNSNSPKDYSFIDENVVAGNYLYRLKQIDNDGKFTYSEVVEVTFNFQPSTSELFQNYPNPFNPSTVIKWQLAIAGHVSLKIFNVLGREVAGLVNQEMSPGEYQVQWNPKNLAAGVYIYTIKTAGYVFSKKMLLIK